MGGFQTSRAPSPSDRPWNALPSSSSATSARAHIITSASASTTSATQDIVPPPSAALSPIPQTSVHAPPFPASPVTLPRPSEVPGATAAGQHNGNEGRQNKRGARQRPTLEQVTSRHAVHPDFKWERSELMRLESPSAFKEQHQRAQMMTSELMAFAGRSQEFASEVWQLNHTLLTNPRIDAAALRRIRTVSDGLRRGSGGCHVYNWCQIGVG